MGVTRRVAGIMAMLVLSGVLAGCSGDTDKRDEKKPLTLQEQMGKEAAQALKKPMDDARNAAAEVEAKANQAPKEAGEGAGKAAQDAGLAPNQSGVREKKKLEGC